MHRFPGRVIGAIALTVGLAACSGGPLASGSSPEPSVTAAVTSSLGSASQAPTQSPAATTSGQPTPLPSEGPNLFPGTYATNFDPPLTLTIAHEVDLDCSPGYECRGNVSVNLPNWLDLEFGNDHGSELMVFGFDKLFDPNSPTQLIDPPADFAAWVSAHQSVSMIVVAHQVVLGGVTATELDVQAGDDGLAYGPSNLDEFPSLALGAGQLVRIDALRLGDRQIVIQRQFGPQHIIGSFAEAADGLQAVIDSLTWGTRP